MVPALSSGLSPVRSAFDNGIVALVQETQTTPAVTMVATFQAGSLYEPAELPGHDSAPHPAGAESQGLELP